MIAATPPVGGIVAEVAGRSRPLLLRQREIERFEAQHDLGIFDVMAALLGTGGRSLQSRWVRDLVALGLVGAGMSDLEADRLVAGIAPGQNVALRAVARDLVLRAFVPPETEAPEKPGADGSPEGSPPSPADGTSGPASAPSPSPDTGPRPSAT